jgi:DNA polymerase-3 subunit delta'
LQLIEPITKFILTEQIRKVRTIAYTRPFELPRRVFIIDSAQDIHWQAVDLLLKVLEEPPESTTFILICPNAYELRSTIRSPDQGPARSREKAPGPLPESRRSGVRGQRGARN